MNEASSLASHQAISSGAAQRAKSDVAVARLELLDAFAGGLGTLDMEIGQRRARRDGIDADSVYRLLTGERPRHGKHAGFRGVVETHAFAASDGIGR